VKLALVEARTERNLGLEPQLPQPAVAVQVRHRLAGLNEGIAVSLLLGHRLGQSDLAH